MKIKLEIIVPVFCGIQKYVIRTGTTLLLLSISLQLVRSEVIYVDKANVGIEDGTTWSSAFSRLEDALAVAKYGDEVWIAAGVYMPNDLTESRLSVYNISAGVSLYGGFRGDETVISQRDIQENSTILSGDINVPNDTSDNCFTIVYLENPDIRNVLDGLIFEHGMAIDEDVMSLYGSPNKSGGAVYVIANSIDSYVTIRNCIFRHNRALYKGGAIYISGRNSIAIGARVTDCTFINNQAISGGGAICFERHLISTDTLLDNCRFYSNFARLGGAVYIRESLSPSIAISSSTFDDNVSNFGACMYFAFPKEETEISITNVVIQDNFERSNYGGALYISGSANMGSIVDVVLDSCKLVNQQRYDSNRDTIYLGRGLVANGVNDVRIKSSYFSSAAIGLGKSSGIVTIENTTLTGCHIYDRVFDLRKDKAILKNVNIYNNASQYRLMNGPDSLEVLNSNISLNSVQEDALISSGSIFIHNSILWGNILYPNISLITESLKVSNVITDLAHFDSVKWFDRWGVLQAITDKKIKDVQFLTDPLFIDSSKDDFRLKSCSPGIDAGSNEAVLQAGLEIDLAGTARIVGGVVDIGPYEQQNPASIEIQFEAANPMTEISNDGRISLLNIIGGVGTYQVMWSSGSSEWIIDSLSAGLYTLNVTDGDGCISQFEIQLEPQTTWGNRIEIELWPNPANRNSVLTIEVVSGQNFVLDINAFDVLGRQIDLGNQLFDVGIGTQRFQVPLDLPYGVYFLEFLKSDERLSVFKVIFTSN